MSQAFCLGVRPPSDLDPPDWMSHNVKLANSERSNKFDITQTKWLRKPLMCLTDHNVKQVVLYAPTGCGKSTMAEGLIPWVISEKPGPFLYMSQTNATSKTWKETRLDYALKSCDYVKKLFPADRHKSRVSDILFPHMPLHIRGANMSNCQELSMQYLYGDEIWRWSPELLREFLGRHHNRWNRKVFLVSQAGYKDDSMDLSYKETDKAEWSFLCECGEWVRYARAHLKYDIVKVKDEIDEQASADTARIECPHCKHSYEDKIGVRRKLMDASDYIETSKGLTGFKGYRMHRLGVWWVPWREYALAELKAKRQLNMGVTELWMQTHQKDDCIPWDDEMSLQRKEIQFTDKKMHGRDPKQHIQDETIRFFTLDKGQEHFWGVVRAWSKGKRSEILWEGYIPSTDDEFKIKEIQKLYDVRDTCVFIDIGFEWSKTAQLCADNGWFGIRGGGRSMSYAHKAQKGKPIEKAYSPIRYTQGEAGRKCAYFEIATDPIKDILARLMSGNGLEWIIPRDISKTYKFHMKSEVRREGQKGIEKKVIGYWETLNRANHLWDCEVYQVAAALMVGIFD